MYIKCSTHRRATIAVFVIDCRAASGSVMVTFAATRTTVKGNLLLYSSPHLYKTYNWGTEKSLLLWRDSGHYRACGYFMYSTKGINTSACCVAKRSDF